MRDSGSPPDRHDLLAAELADHYLIEEELGRGGSATVYLAQDLRHGRRVALKVLHSALGAALGVERFQREIRTHARLQHPHILPLYDSGSAAGRLYYTMPYVEAGSRRPDPPGVLEATVRTAVARARGLAPDLPLVAGGKSMGGRMTSSAAARRPLDAVRGLIFLGFPLHPSKQPSTTRAEHLAQASLPMLFLQGTRDTLADLAKHPVPEVVHGAGGMEYHDGKFIIVGGLPPGVGENYLYEYDENFRFRNRHALASGYTLMGIQTASHADGAWWFGCYGKPAVLLRADEKFQVTGKWEFNASVGIAPIRGGRFLIAQNTAIKDDDGKTQANQACVVIARPEDNSGMEIEKPCSQ